MKIYKNRAGYNVFAINVKFAVGYSEIVAGVAYLNDKKEKVTKASVKKAVEHLLYLGGISKMDWFYEDYSAAALEEAERIAKKLYPELWNNSK